ncbi:PDZ domain-containing protein [Riemerella columbina]|uniref:PDZ domain-containing protein n=1 Tax=Riemerella columbina TaxID=103810 RepID=UPI002670A62B|nr:PDZ domain-containing protein [Riemerella columbina]WKS94546.1 PDZ domain-containing protein [Riemerella columbina]
MFDKAFRLPLTGFTLEEEQGKIQIKNIPFYQKGLRKGDQILSINGKTCLETMEEELKKGGKKMKLKHLLYHLLK